MPSINIARRLRRSTALATTALCALVTSAYAEDATPLPPVPVESPLITGDLLNAPLNATVLDAESIRNDATRTSDTASILVSIAGVSAYEAGGVSSLPAIHGLADDRVLILVDGMVVSVACPNHMNPPLSYIDPTRVGSARAIAGITPVSLGGDSIAGTIEVNSAAPQFSQTGDVTVSGTASTFYRSNGDAYGATFSATLAGQDFAIGYSGSMAGSSNYDGGGRDDVVRSSAYQSMNHAITLAARDGHSTFVLQAGQQYIPYEGYPNQYMDMTLNQTTFVNGSYEGDYSWGTVEGRAYWQAIQHKMNFLGDKGGLVGGGMPMDTNSGNAGLSLKVTLPFSERDTLRLGGEYRHMTLDDWWPPVAGSMMMGPDTYWNINNGKRDRIGVFAEWETKWNPEWSTLLGVRGDFVSMNTGDVQPYSWVGMMSMDDAMAAMAFNSVGHKRSDGNFDFTALARYTPDADSAFEFGYARKTRSPNLYERYSWGRGVMSSSMVSWFGDGNGYVGNLGLKPETANTISASADWQGGTGNPWEVKITPYYTYIENYIGVTKLQDFMSMGMPTGFVQLQFVNQDAEVYGVDIAGAVRLWSTDAEGTGTLKGTVSWVQSENTTTGGGFYHIMPLNARLSLEHKLGGWTGTLETVLVADKSRVETVRNEPETGGYALFNIRGSYDFGMVRVDAGVDNIFDTSYALPLGGQSLGDMIATGTLRPVPGYGRSFNAALTVSF